MNTLTVAVLVVAVAATSASGIIGAHGILGGGLLGLGHGGIGLGHGAIVAPDPIAIANAANSGRITGAGSPAVLAGPSGSIVRSGVAPVANVAPAVVAAPALVAGHGGIIGPAGILGAGLIGGGGIIGGHGGIIAGHGLLAPGSGHEGQWIPDINEHLYDDGSYKPHIYGH